MKALTKKIKRVRSLFFIYIVEGIFLRSRITEFYKILAGHIFFETLFAASELDIFSLLAKHKRLNAEEIANKVGIELKHCNILLLGLVSLKLIKKKGKFYKNSLLAKRVLDKNKEESISNIIRWQHFASYRPMSSFYQSLVEGRNVGINEVKGRGETIYKRLDTNPELGNLLGEAREDLAVQVNRMFIEQFDLGDSKSLLDVGGASDLNVLQLSEAYPNLKLALFDSSSACDIAERIIRLHGCEKSVSVYRGDYFKNDFPVGADVFLFSHFFTIWSLEKNLFLLKKAYNTLPNDGRVIILNQMQNNNRTGPISAAMNSSYLLTLVSGEGMIYTWNEYEGLLKQAGFRKISKKRLPLDHGMIVGYK